MHTGEMDDFATIEQRRRDCFEGIRSTDEQDLTKVYRNINIMVLLDCVSACQDCMRPLLLTLKEWFLMA